MPTVKDLRTKHPEFKWTAVNGARPNDWSYEGVRDKESVRIVSFEGIWYVDSHVRAGQFVITGRPEEYKEWSETQIERMKEDRDGQ